MVIASQFHEIVHKIVNEHVKMRGTISVYPALERISRELSEKFETILQKFWENFQSVFKISISEEIKKTVYIFLDN